MSNSKKNLMLATVKSGLSSANKGNPFWSKRDAFQLLNLTRKNQKA